MKKAVKAAIAVGITSGLLLAGCGKAAGVSADKSSAAPGWSSITQSSTAAEKGASQEDGTGTGAKSGSKSEAETKAAGTEQDYTKYLKKTWIRKQDTGYPDNGGVSITLTQISGGVLKGSIDAVGGGPAYNMDSADLEGKVSQNTAQCQLVNDSRENSGNVSIQFKSDRELEAEVTLTKKSQDTIMTLPEGKAEYVPYTLDMVKGFQKISEQSFPVTLNQWGNVQFVSGKLTGGDHVPDEFYLTDEEGDILYNFYVTLPYQMDVQAVSFPDINKDGLKDLIIIVSDSEDKAGAPVASISFQDKSGSFSEQTDLNQKVNASGQNGSVKSILKYLADHP